MRFKRALLKFTIWGSVLAATLLIVAGAFILLFPQFVWMALTYLLGGGLLLFGLAVLVGLLVSFLRTKIVG